MAKCTSCEDGLYLDQLSFRCLAVCPAATTVATILPDPEPPFFQEKICDPCHQNCLSCSSEDTSICLECREGLKMVEQTKQCFEECPARTAEIWLPITQDILCAECVPGCSACQYARDHCTECDPGFFFYEFSCLEQCPAGFSPESSTSNNCVRTQKICDFGFELDENGECVLEVAHCKAGYVLNPRSKDKCIPEPGFHLPFAFLFVAGGWAYYILKRQDRKGLEREHLVNQLLLGFVTI